jgi:nucleotide-binding universal stress UspA family protein
MALLQGLPWRAPPLPDPVLAGNILVAVDGSAGAQRALSYAAALARVGHGRLTLLAVMPPPVWMRMAVPPPGYDPRAEEAGWEHVLRAAVKQVPADVPVTTQLVRGAPAEAIVKWAAEGCHDLVVLGCEGRGPLHGLIGGVSRKVLRRSTVPVLVVRS